MKNAALQRKVQLMKLKLKAVGPDTVPEQRRFYIQAHTENNIVGMVLSILSFYFSAHMKVVCGNDARELLESLENHFLKFGTL